VAEVPSAAILTIARTLRRGGRTVRRIISDR
jgi:hypothetical protein